MSKATQKLLDWQRRMSEQPTMYAVYLAVDGEVSDTGNLYDSLDGAELEAEWWRGRGRKGAKAGAFGQVHSLELAKERWTR